VWRSHPAPCQYLRTRAPRMIYRKAAVLGAAVGVMLDSVLNAIGVAV
jgi:hypothetical protein